ncbi:phBC6A51 family helix-turn-helix protein [Syntrophomonas wolfei]|jgi:uncharacterized protein YggE|uniref:phBC6A51 family helix-turn-helix protein n=1 Tax=Syntrophomonas wolfei TaxID=863 RepID=UPI0023F331E7|nr:phBC6A51 family helix-turn-helix protein [Syntrophomonas wolfei]
MTTIKTGHGEKQSRKRELLICALLVEPTIEKAAAKVGIGTTTAFRWLQEPDFQAEYQQARKQAVSQAIAQLQQATTQAVATLVEVMNDQEATPASRVSATKIVLEMSMKAIELDDLATRIERLEQALEGQQGGKRAWR